jgi:uncharacterized membrane protein
MARTRPGQSSRSETESVALGAARAEHPSLQRIGGFSDGVFAFAITLLILAIRIPDPRDPNAAGGLLPLLTQQWRSYLAFVMTFMLIGVTWANHRVLFSKFARADTALVWLNLLNLMIGGVFMPIPTAVLGRWLGSSSYQDQVVAAVFYGLGATVGLITFNLVWWYGAYGAKLTHPELSDAQRRAHTLAWGAAIPVLAILTAVAFISPQAAVAGFIAVIVAYVLPLAALVARIGRRSAPSGVKAARTHSTKSSEDGSQ